MVLFRENTEDIYAGIEFETGTEANQTFLSWLKSTYPEKFNNIRFPESSGIAIKPISRQGSQRFIRAAIVYALNNKRSKLTLVHKGNIMKFTEGAFAKWCYDLAETEFSEQVFTQRKFNHLKEIHGDAIAQQFQADAIQAGKLIINDVITDAAFEQTLTRPEEFDVIATTNLNGDLLSDALSAQIGGLGIAPGANINADENIAVFEATHGTAPTLAGKNLANPSSLILSGALMLDHIGWHESAELVRAGIRKTIKERIFTQDFHRTTTEATRVSTTEFGQAVIRFMHTDIESGL
jgi:isocitrate dehydrogenase